MVLAEDENTRDGAKNLPPSNDPRAFFYGRVWFDNNANGVMDEGEEGVPRVRVSLWRTDSAEEIKTRMTEDDGTFLMPLKAISKKDDYTYYIKLSLKRKQRDIFSFFEGGDSNLGSVDERGEGVSEFETIPRGTTSGRYEINAGVRAKTAIFYGTVWHDNNANGFRDEGEERVRTTVTLWRTKDDGTPAEKIRKTKTSRKSGNYIIPLEEDYDLDTHNYFVVFRLPENSYAFPTEGDIQVEKDGRGEPTSVARGKRYRTNVGIRPIGAAFYGKMWFDDDGDGIIEKGEEGVPNAEVSLFRKPSDRPLVKREYTLDDGTFTLNLKKIDPNLNYYLRFRDQTGQVDIFLDHVGESNVDGSGRTSATSLEYQKRYKLNAGITCPAIAEEDVDRAISNLEIFWQNITSQYQEITAHYVQDASVVLDIEAAIEEMTNILELNTTDADNYKNYLRGLYVIQRCDVLLRLEYFNSELDESMLSLAVVSPDGILKFEPIIDMFAIVPDLNVSMPDPNMTLAGTEPEGTRALQGIRFPVTFDVSKAWTFDAPWARKASCLLNVQVITNDLCTGPFSATFTPDDTYPVKVTPGRANPPVTKWRQANPRCDSKFMDCGLVNFPFTVSVSLGIPSVLGIILGSKAFTIGAWVCANGARSSTA